MPPEQTLRLIRAQDLTLRCTLLPPRDITGWTVTFEVEDKLAGAAVITKTVGAGITLADTGKGILEVALAKADTSGLTVSSALAAGKGYVWEIKRTNAGSNVVLARGQLILEQEVVS
jgi:hypothetical protein